jgi:hypothetical protein
MIHPMRCITALHMDKYRVDSYWDGGGAVVPIPRLAEVGR